MANNWTRRDFLALTGIAGAGLLLPPAARGAAGSSAWPLSAGAESDGWSRVPGFLSRIVPPTFPARDFDIRKSGAVGDGVKDCTAAVAAASAACHGAGGGRVVVPEGTFLTGGLRLKSGVDLHLASA